MSLNAQGFNYLNHTKIMKKSILNLGKPLDKTQQRHVTGGRMPICLIDNSLPECDDNEGARL